MTLALPLRLDGSFHILDANGAPIAMLYFTPHVPVRREHGEEIVAAINSHDRLLAAAKAGLEALQASDLDPQSYQWVKDAIAAAEAAQ